METRQLSVETADVAGLTDLTDACASFLADIAAEDGLLTVSGERQFERKDDRNYHRIERAYGSFTRTFTLPRSVDANQIKADYRNGVLEVEIPKKEDSRPKQIQVNVNASKQLDA